MGSGDELDPCVCMASTLPTELFSQPCVLHFGDAQTATEHKGTSACFLARNTFLFSGSEIRNGEFLQEETGVGSGLLTYQTLGETMVSEPFPRLENALCRGHWHPKPPY